MEQQYLTIVLVVFFGAIVVFFAEEFKNIFKRIFEIKGAKLVLPLAFASWIVYAFLDWVLFFVTYYQEILTWLVNLVAQIIPTSYAVNIAMMLVLSFISVVPVLLLDRLWYKKFYRAYDYPFVTGLIILIVSAECLFAN